MAGIYIHIPFCKQACHYCNFHFSTSLKLKNDFLGALLKEAKLQKDYLQGESIETIYLGGGTPSLLSARDCESLMEKIHGLFDIAFDVEITLEANPDDVNEERLRGWQKSGINRLSIGVQSFFEEDLQWMNRAHNAAQARQAITAAQDRGFENFTIDLIYGIPTLTDAKWRENVDQFLQWQIPHLSAYALTVESGTALEVMMKKNKVQQVNADDQADQFLLLMDWMESAGYEHYEISNFAIPGKRSKHNSSYWQGKKYLGLGPSAHSYNGITRQWNIANNSLYIQSLGNTIVPFEKEELTETQKLNEYIMTSLRTMEGLDMNYAQEQFDKKTRDDIAKKTARYIKEKLVAEENNHIKLTREGKLFADKIAVDLFGE